MIYYLKQKFSDIPASILVCVVILLTFGFLSLYSVSQNQQAELTQTSFFKQFIFLGISLTAFIITVLVPLRLLHKYIYSIYGISILLILLPFFLPPVAGTYRWIQIGGFGFQPSEYAKWVVVLTLARYLTDHRLDIMKMVSLIIPFMITLIPVAIVLRQPDLGTSIIIASTIIPVLYWFGIRPYYLFLIVAPIITILAAFHTVSFSIWVLIVGIVIYMSRTTLVKGILIFFGNIFIGLLTPLIWNSLHSYQQKRLLTLFNPELDPLGAAYQIIQSQTAIGSGGIWGKGFGQGTQTHLKFLPVQESDFIFSVIGEEFGFIVVSILLFVYAWMIIRMFRLAYTTKEQYSGLVITGIATIFMSHIFVNIAMTIGLIPVKGLPLPFISYGGSFLLSSFIMLGLVLNLGNRSGE